MPKKKPSKAYQQSLLQQAADIHVRMTVPYNHPLLVLKRTLDWPKIRGVCLDHLRKAGCNVDHHPGRPLDVDLYIPLLVLMLVKNLNSRQMEEYLAENAAARVFIDWEHNASQQVRDHSNIARILEALGPGGIEALNALLIHHAVELGFADPTVLSADTTAQELPVGYPHEAGILNGLGQRCIRACSKLLKKGKRKLKETQEKFVSLTRKAKEYHLFAKGKEEKDVILHDMVRQTSQALKDVEAIVERYTDEADRSVRSAIEQLQKMVTVGKKLLPQIEYWLETGTVAAEKIIHAGITDARAIVRNKVGKKVEFGFQYLLCSIGGGYLMGQMLTKPIGETKMPLKAVAMHRELFGEDTDIDLFTYDRGGWSEGNVKKLRKEGVKKVGIQPKGRADWEVHGMVREKVKTERAMMEGKVGTLKTEKHKFNKPKARKSGPLRAAGQRSIFSFNANKLITQLLQPTASA